MIFHVEHILFCLIIINIVLTVSASITLNSILIKNIELRAGSLYLEKVQLARERHGIGKKPLIHNVYYLLNISIVVIYFLFK